LKGIVDNLAIKYFLKYNTLIIWILVMKRDLATSSTNRVVVDYYIIDRIISICTFIEKRVDVILELI
jgi:hypothetical protein